MKPIDHLTDDEWLALVQHVMTMPDAPPPLLQQALALWHLQQAPRHPQPLPQRWAAVRSFDSWAGASVAAGMRALPSEVRQMIFAAAGCDIDLRIAPAADGFALSGQLFGRAAEGSVELATPGRDDEGPQHSVALDALSEFRIDGVRRGTYQVTLRLGGDEIVLPPIDVGLPRDASGP